MSNITLETDRLIIRPFKVSEANIVAYNSRQPRVAEHMSDMILVDEKAGLDWINWINSMCDIETPFQVLAIELKAEQKCIGIMGIAPQSKIQGEFEILFSITDKYQCNGYATEAAKRIIKWFFKTKGGAYLCAIVKVNNLPSQRVIEKSGFTFIEEREILYDCKMTQFKYYRLPERIKKAEYTVFQH